MAAIDDIDEDFFCCLCWRSTYGVYPAKTKNLLFCKNHLCSGDSKKVNFQDTRRLIRGLTNRGYVIPEGLNGSRLYRHLSRNLTNISVNPKYVIESGPFFEKASVGSPQFRVAVSRFFPITFKQIKHCFEQPGAEKLISAIVNDLFNSPELTRNSIVEEQQSISVPQRVEPYLLIHILARHEAYRVLHEITVKAGPALGYGRNHQLREDIIRLYNEFLDAGIYRCQSKIATILGISRPRVSTIVKELMNENKLKSKNKYSEK